MTTKTEGPAVEKAKRKYRLSGTYHIDFTVEIEADDRETAIQWVEEGGFPAIESGANGFEQVEVDSCDEVAKRKTKAGKKRQ